MTRERKITLVGVGKEDAFAIRTLRQGLFTIAKIAKKHRDTNIGVIVPFASISTRVVADYLAAADYKYDAYITVKKEDKRLPINATLCIHQSGLPQRICVACCSSACNKVRSASRTEIKSVTPVS